MRDIRIQLLPFEFISILNIDIHKSLNNHATVKLSGRISEKQEEALMSTTIKNTSIALMILDDENQQKLIFSGIVKDFLIQETGDSRILQLNCISSTYLMDTAKRTRVFQNAGTTYNAVLEKLNTYGDYGCILSSGDGAAINRMIVQYGETDFEFVKRLATHFHTSICPAYLSGGVKYYFGIPNNNKSFELTEDYAIRREITQDLRRDEEELPYSIGKGNSMITFSSREVYEIGNCTTVKGKKYIVAEINSHFTGAELVHQYRMKEQMGLYLSKKYNPKIVGASLSAHITSVSKDKVTAYIHEDGIQDGAVLFPYSTVYSSPDGTGWYCMPEENDSVRIYFPTEKEHHSYAISAVHVQDNQAAGQAPSQAEPPRSNPDIKSIKTKYGKEVMFTPKTLLFTNNDGTTIKIDDEEGITIESPNMILIKSESEIEMTSIGSSINMVGTELIEFKQSSTSMKIENNIDMLGDKVQIE